MAAAAGEEKAERGPTVVPVPVHEIVVRNGVLQLLPPLQEGRSHWIAVLHRHVAVVIDLPRLQASGTLSRWLLRMASAAGQWHAL